MACVSFQKLSSRKIPEPQSIIKSSNKNKLPIGRELGKANRRMLIINQSLHTMAGGSIPDPTKTIVATRNDHGAVQVEINGGDRVGMRGKNLEAFPRLDIPNADSLIEGTRGKHVGLWIEIDAENIIGVAGEGFDEGAGGDVPDADGAIVGGGGKEAAVGGEGHVGDAGVVAMELVVGSVGGRDGVSAGGLVASAGSEEATVVGEFDGGDGAFVTGETMLEAVGFIGVGWLRR